MSTKDAFQGQNKVPTPLAGSKATKVPMPDHGNIQSGLANAQRPGEVPHSLPYDHEAMLNSPTRTGLQPKGKK